MNTASKQHRLAKGLALVAGASVLALAAGCANNQPPIAHGEDFTPPGASTSMGRLAEAQAANGARSDATLGTQHFNGDQLNSLGEVKLDLMLRAAPSNTPVTIYVNMPKGTDKDSVDACKAAVTTYLVDAGVAQTDIQLVEGPNPNATAPAAYDLQTTYKTAGGSYDGSAADSLGASDLNSIGANSIGGGGGGH